MTYLKHLTFIISEATLFGALGGLFVWVAIYLQFEVQLYIDRLNPSRGGIDICYVHPLKTIPFEGVIIFLAISFLLGKLVFALFKKQNLQWVYNLLFFITIYTYIDLYVTYLNITEMKYELTLETFDSMGNFRVNILMFLFLLLYSFLYQIIKTGLLSKSKAIW